MPLGLKGYVLEPPRVGTANSAFTMTPNVVITDQGAYQTRFPASETTPRAEYMVLAMSNGKLVDAKFGYTKNEVINRFDFDGSLQRYRTLPGGPLLIPGVVSTTLNTSGQRYKLPIPVVISAPTAAAPSRLSVGTGSGTTLTLVPVTSFSDPADGTVQQLTVDSGPDKAGELKWSTNDLVTYLGQTVRFQRQAFFAYDESKGRLGLKSEALLLNPLPATGQYPLVRVGFDGWLIPDEFPDESTFGTPPIDGHVKWAFDTGRIKLPASVAASKVSYYDGVLMAGGLALPHQSVGTLGTPTTFPHQAVAGGDLIFQIQKPTMGYPQIQYYSYVDLPFDLVGKTSVVQLNDGGVNVTPKFSFLDIAVFGFNTAVELYFGDLPLEHGISMRFFRTPINYDGLLPGATDVVAMYVNSGATFAAPIVGSPVIFLPQAPRDTGLAVRVEQGTGTSLANPFLELSTYTASTTNGFIMDSENKQLQFAMRRNDVLMQLQQPSGAVVLPDPMIRPGSLTLSLETGEGTEVFNPLTIDQDVLFDGNSTVTFITEWGPLVVLDPPNAGSGTMAGQTLTDANGGFGPVSIGDLLVVSQAGTSYVFTITGKSNTTLTVDVGSPISDTVTYEVHRGREVLADRYFAPVELVDPATKVERILNLGTCVNATTVIPVTATGSYLNTTTFKDLGADFLVDGVQVGDTLKITTAGTDLNTFRTILTVAPLSLTVLDPFTEFSGAPAREYTIIRRLHVPMEWIDSTLSRFRFGTHSDDPFSGTVALVNNDASFTAPSPGVVQISRKTGNLNFSASQIGGAVFWARTLRINRDYTISPVLGFIHFTDRFLKLEEALITYNAVDANTSAPIPTVEPAVFLIRKEICQAHPTPTSVLHFNQAGLIVAQTPPPEVWRGGRPQDLTVQCTVDTVASTITFLPDDDPDILPHGAVMGPTENVYIDYYVTQAVGGEQSLTVQLTPMAIARVTLVQDGTGFVVAGDQTASLIPGSMLRVEQSEAHLIDTVLYNGPANQTTLTLVAGDTFQDDYNNNPKLYQSSGLTRVAADPIYPNYFPTEVSPFTLVPRGMNKLTVAGNRLAAYRQGTIIQLTDGAATWRHFYVLTAAAVDAQGNTVLTLTTNTRQQYEPGYHLLSYSAHPILETGAHSVTTQMSPVMQSPMTVWKRIEGQAGQVLSPGRDYLVDPSGILTYAVPLVLNEEISIFYTGYSFQPAWLQLKASYTAAMVPSIDNGLAGQLLVADYTIDSPDTFYFRVETMTNFRAEVAKQYNDAAKASVPSGGPQVSNSASPTLPTQGRPSIYFDEGHLANEDIVARYTLKWYNDTINYLEDVLQDMDGRVIGHHSGRLLFDGLVDNDVRQTWTDATNQIDDIFKVSDAPYTISFAGGSFAVASVGTYQAAYLPAPPSRFYPTGIQTFGVIASTGASKMADPVYDTKHRSLTSILEIRTRLAWAVVTKDAEENDTILHVDTATGSATLARPPLKSGMQCLVQKVDGTFINTDSPNTRLIIQTVDSQTQLTLTAPIAAGKRIPAGSTIFRSSLDPSVQTGADLLNFYQLGRDYMYDADGGKILYVKPFPPLDGSFPGVPPELCAKILQPNQALNCYIGFNNILTAPVKIPVLFGQALEDSGNMEFPIISPSFSATGHPQFEYAAKGDPTITHYGLLVDLVADLTTLAGYLTDTIMGTGGTLDVTRTILTATAPFVAPLPKDHDLVRITNSGSPGDEFRRIVVGGVGASTLTVDAPWPIAYPTPGSFDYVVTVSTSPVAGPGNGTFTGTNLTDLNTIFGPVRVGYTVVVESGPYSGQRRQVVEVLSTTQLTLDYGLGANGPYQYRIDNSIATFGGLNSLLANISTNLGTLLALYQTHLLTPWDEIEGIQKFFQQVFTQKTFGTGTSDTTTTFTDNSKNFTALGVVAGDVLFLRSQQPPGLGVYTVTTVGTTTLQVDTAISPGSASNSYTVNSVFGVTLKGLRDLWTILRAVDALAPLTSTFRDLIDTPVSVVVPGLLPADPPGPDPTHPFARALTQVALDLNFFRTLLTNREAAVSQVGTGYVDMLSNFLGGSERFYDKRFVWLDARINLSTGILSKKSRAVAARVQAGIDVANQLFKLLAVQ